MSKFKEEMKNLLKEDKRRVNLYFSSDGYKLYIMVGKNIYEYIYKKAFNIMGEIPKFVKEIKRDELSES